MRPARVAGREFDLDAGLVERAMIGVDPEPIHEHYVVVLGQRFPPKQVLSTITGLDRADFTTHQARSILRRLGFGVHRVGQRPSTPHDPARGPHGGAEAEALRPYAGKWVAQRDLDVLFADDDPRVVVRWLRTHGQSADAVFQVPATAAQTGSAMVQPK
jgi:hypothetical protein